MSRTATASRARFAVFAAAATLFAPAAFAATPSKPVSGHLTLHAQSADVGVGFTWGDGVLVYHGVRHHFTVSGGTIAAVGYSKISGRGTVYGLEHLHDFDGTYAALNGEATLDHGLYGQILQNGNGVQIRIDGITRGARLAGAAQGLELKIKD